VECLLIRLTLVLHHRCKKAVSFQRRIQELITVLLLRLINGSSETEIRPIEDERSKCATMLLILQNC